MAFLNPYEDPDAAKAKEYDFLTEISPGVWKVSDKTNRVEWLAHDMTVLKQPWDIRQEEEVKGLQDLIQVEQRRILKPMLTILSHDNLVRLKDWVTIKKKSPFGRDSGQTSYAIWDYCDAGVLANLLVQNPLPLEPEKRYPEQEMEKPYLGRTISPFLPESFCWHVLLSVLKALAWLHDGSWEIILGVDGHYKTSPLTDWQPILHRNITPNNIFLQHPEGTEAYGPCKLGNYGNLFISSHHHGDGSAPKVRDYSKPLAPHPLTEFTPLEDLVEDDANMGYTYPQQPDQPYTIVSELRALGEVIQKMMIQNNSLLRERSIEENLRWVSYSSLLKNMVAMLMTFNPDERDKNGNYVQGTRECFTSMLCTVAYERFRDWHSTGTPEAQKATTRDSAIRKSQIEEVFANATEDVRLRMVHNIQATDDKVDGSLFAIPEHKPQNIDHLPIVDTSSFTPYKPFKDGIDEEVPRDLFEELFRVS